MCKSLSRCHVLAFQLPGRVVESVVVVTVQERVIIVMVVVGVAGAVVVVVVVACILNRCARANAIGATVVVEIGASPGHVPLSIRESSRSSTNTVHCLGIFFANVVSFKIDCKERQSRRWWKRCVERLLKSNGKEE